MLRTIHHPILAFVLVGVSLAFGQEFEARRLVDEAKELAAAEDTDGACVLLWEADLALSRCLVGANRDKLVEERNALLATVDPGYDRKKEVVLAGLSAAADAWPTLRKARCFNTALGMYRRFTRLAPSIVTAKWSEISRASEFFPAGEEIVLGRTKEDLRSTEEFAAASRGDDRSREKWSPETLAALASPEAAARDLTPLLDVYVEKGMVLAAAEFAEILQELNPCAERDIESILDKAEKERASRWNKKHGKTARLYSQAPKLEAGKIKGWKYSPAKIVSPRSRLAGDSILWIKLKDATGLAFEVDGTERSFTILAGEKDEARADAFQVDLGGFDGSSWLRGQRQTLKSSLGSQSFGATGRRFLSVRIQAVEGQLHVWVDSAYIVCSVTWPEDAYIGIQVAQRQAGEVKNRFLKKKIKRKPPEQLTLVNPVYIGKD